MCILMTGLLCENMTSFRKPEIHNLILQCDSRSTYEQRPQATCTKNSVKFGHVVFEIFKETVRQTDIGPLITFCTPLWGEVNMIYFLKM